MAQIVETQSCLKEIVGLGANQAGDNHAKSIIAEGLDDPDNLVELSGD